MKLSIIFRNILVEFVHTRQHGICQLVSIILGLSLWMNMNTRTDNEFSYVDSPDSAIRDEKIFYTMRQFEIGAGFVQKIVLIQKFAHEMLIMIILDHCETPNGFFSENRKFCGNCSAEECRIARSSGSRDNLISTEKISKIWKSLIMIIYVQKINLVKPREAKIVKNASSECEN